MKSSIYSALGVYSKSLSSPIYLAILFLIIDLSLFSASKTHFLSSGIPRTLVLSPNFTWYGHFPTTAPAPASVHIHQVELPLPLIFMVVSSKLSKFPSPIISRLPSTYESLSIAGPTTWLVFIFTMGKPDAG